MERDKNILGTEPIGHLLLKFAIPGIVSMLVNSIYNIVDQIFIGQGVGYLGNTATTVFFPMVQLMLALSLMTSVGTAANVSLNQGRGDYDEGDRFLGNGLIMAIFFGITVFLITEFFTQPLMHAFGGTKDVMPYVLPYGRIIAAGFPFVSTSILMSDIIRADGKPHIAMASMLAGAITNCILDPVAIFVLHWGVTGAAIATIAGQILSFIIAAFQMTKLSHMKVRTEYMKPSLERMGQIMLIGLSALLTNLAALVATIVLNNTAKHYGELSKYGADIPLACFGIVMKINGIMMAIIIGITSATQPIFSFNFGAEKYKRVKELIFKTAVTTFVVGLVCWFMLQNFPEQIISIFGQEHELYNEFAVMCLKNMTLLIFVMGIPMMAGTYFQSIGNPFKAALLSLSRQLLFSIPLMVILPIYMGIVGVMYSYPLADIFSIGLSATLLVVEVRKLDRLILEGEEKKAA